MGAEAREQTKERILQEGALIIHRKGFNNTGIQEILDAADVPKGSFYFYFKNKEDFGLQIVDYFTDQFSRMAGRILNNTSTEPLQRIDDLLVWFMDFFKANEFTCGCPVGNLSQEMGDLSDKFRDRLEKAIDSMADGYTRVLEEAQERGDLPGNMDVREAAYFIIAGWHGALVRMKVVKGLGPLENHRKFIFDYVLVSDSRDPECQKPETRN